MMFFKSFAALATCSFLITLQLSVPSICTTHYGHKEPLAADWIQIGEETDKEGITIPIYTVCKPA